jgi:hypothetical protein
MEWTFQQRRKEKYGVTDNWKSAVAISVLQPW